MLQVIAASILAVAACDTSPRQSSRVPWVSEADDDGSIVAPPPLVNVPADAEFVSDASPGFPNTEWCTRFGGSALRREAILFEIVGAYMRTLTANCRIRGLTRFIGPAQSYPWRDYLLAYTNAMVGCAPVYGNAPGGVRAFGPANLKAIGIQRGALGKDDVDALIDAYSGPLAERLQLSVDERSFLLDWLEQSAAAESDDGLTSTLSECETDAG